MNTEEEKGKIEIEVFTKFARTANLPIDFSTIQKRKPPEPDINCISNTEGELTYELVEICDSNIAKLHSELSKSEVGGVTSFRTSDPSKLILSKKLKKTYSTGRPIELLAYLSGRVITPIDVVTDILRHEVGSTKSCFRKIWIYDYNKDIIYYDAS